MLVSVEAMNTDSNIADVFSSFQHYAVIRKFKEVLKSLQKLDDSWRGEYINQELMELQFQLISLISMEKEVKKFLKENMDNPVMRERMIESAMEQGDYEKVV